MASPEPTGVIEAQAISFIFQIAFWALTSVVASLIIYIWSQSKAIQANKEEVITVKEELNKKISDVELKLAVNSEKDSHIDKELGEIKKWMEKIEGQISEAIKKSK